MAVTTVSITRRRAWADERGQYRTIVYQVVFDAPPADPAEALTATDGVTTIPAIGADYPGSTTIKCRKVGEAAQDDNSRMIYEVPVEFSDVAEGGGFGGSGVRNPNPLERPADIDWDHSVIDVIVEKDLATGAAIRNSAGDPFDPPLVESVYLPTVRIGRNVASHSVAQAYAVINTVNAGAITIAGAAVGPKQACMKKFGASAHYEGGVSYVRQEIEIAFAPSFMRSLLDQGFYYLSGNDKKPFRDAEGNPMTEPRLLNGSGAPSASAVYLDFNTKVAASWAALNLPDIFPAV